MRSVRSFLPLLVLIAIGVALLASGALDRFRPETLAAEQARLAAMIVAHPLAAGLLQIGAVALSIATGMPGVVVLIFAGGMLFGVLVGTVLSTLGMTLGATILFLASRHAFGDHSRRDAPSLVERLRTGYHRHPISYTFFLRLVPFFPFGGVTIGLAWLRCPLWLFLAATTAGGALMTGIETALGAGLARNIGEHRAVSLALLHDPAVVLPLLAMGLLALVPVAWGHWRARRGAQPTA
jgi:uncharacterized membrane protein YdjX (TVP38/TMEM64 family)